MSVASGAVHRVPVELRKAIVSSQKVLTAWNSLTPLARNEWICWVTSAKKSETRTKRIKVGYEQLASGKRRPCCWPGCPHRKKAKL